MSEQKKLYCAACFEPLEERFVYCPICGEPTGRGEDRFGYYKEIDEARVYILRGEYSRALELYNALLSESVRDINCYVGIVRARSENYTDYLADGVAEAVSLAEQVAGEENLPKLDPDFLAFLEKWKAGAAERARLDKERREKEAAERLAQQKREREALESAAIARAEAQRREKERQRAAEAAKRAEWEKRQRDALDAMRLESQMTVTADGTLVRYVGRARKIVLPSHVRRIAEGVFRSNAALVELEATAVTEVGRLAFNGCMNLERVAFAEGLVSIGEMAFGCCPKLRDVQVPRTLENIEAHAFWDCDSLRTVTLERGGYVAKNAFSSKVKIIYI